MSSAAITFEGRALGAIESRYGPTCRTTWARLSNHMNHVPGDAHGEYGRVIRDSDGQRYECGSPPGPNTTCWTAMVDDAAVTSYAYGNIDPYPTYGYRTAEARTANHRSG